MGKTSLAEKIKNHPFVVIIILFGAFITGLTTFTSSLNQISKQVACLPIKVGFDNEYQGVGTLNYILQKQDWKQIGTVQGDKSTSNHHCSSNCSGEPTRTNYRIAVSTDDFNQPKLGDRKLLNPKLVCISGPCGAWNQVLNVSVSEDSLKANASFDVWSHPTNWTLTADIYEFQVISEDRMFRDFNLSSKELLRIEVPNEAVEVVISGNMEDQWKFALNPHGKNNSQILSLNATENSLEQRTYIYQVNDIRCQ